MASRSTESPEEINHLGAALTSVVSLASLLGRSRRIRHGLSRTQRRRAIAGRIDSCAAGNGYRRRRCEKRMLMNNQRTVANQLCARLAGFVPPKRVGLAFGQLRPARWESWPSSSHVIVGYLRGRGSPQRFEGAAHKQPGSWLASRRSAPCQPPCSPLGTTFKALQVR